MPSALDSIGLTACTVSVNGAELPTDAANDMVSVRVSRGLSMTGRAVVRFNDLGYTLASSSDYGLGTAVTIKADTTSIFEGVITGTALEYEGGTFAPQFAFTADDKSFKLGLTKHIRTFETMKMSDVISQLTNSYGLSLNMASPNDPVQDYLLQSGTDLAMLDTITKRLNYVWWVEGSTLNVQPAGDMSRTEASSLDLLTDLMEFSVRASGLRPSSIKVNGWDPKAKQDIKGSATSSDSVAQSPFTDGYSSQKRSALVGSDDFLAGDATPTSQAEAQLAAGSLLTMWQGDAVTARGLSLINAKVTPNAIVAVTGGGPSNGKYLVSEVEHIFSSRGFLTRFTAGQMRQSALVDKLAVAPAETGFVNHSLTTAVVSEVGGGSGSGSDKPGMVKVKFNGLTGDVASAWARVLSFGGGDKRGGVFLPEINDEVLLGFEGGDTRRPVVLGALFNGKDAFAAGGDINDNGKVAYRRITSRENNVIELSDGASPDKQHVKITAVSDDQQLRIGADRGDIKYPDGKPFAITVGSSSIEFDGKGNITIKGLKISLQADQDIDIQAKANLTGKGTAKVSWQGAQAELKADAQVTVQGGAQAVLKGAIVQIN
jgi:phage protein D